MPSDSQFMRLREAWYKSEPVMFEIIKDLIYRETVIIETVKKTTIRCIKANAVVYLIKNFEQFGFYRNKFNLYGSLAKFPNMPMFHFNPKQRREEMTEFNKTADSLMEGYDLLLDIDNPDLRSSYTTTQYIKRIFDKIKIPYILKFSGNKGFHLTVPYEEFPDWLKNKNVPELADIFKEFGANFQTIHNLPDLDISIFDTRRISKTAYSVVLPYYLVALPLSDEMFEEFRIELVSLPHWYSRRDLIKNRGLLCRPGDPEAFGDFIKEYTGSDFSG